MIFISNRSTGAISPGVSTIQWSAGRGLLRLAPNVIDGDKFKMSYRCLQPAPDGMCLDVALWISIFGWKANEIGMFD